MKTAALIPARSGSLRVKDKNIRLLGKYPLIVRKIKQLQSSSVDEIFLGSDNSEYLEIAKKFGATPILRSRFSCDESKASSNDMISDFVSKISDDFDIILWSHCTNPFLYGRHYDAAIKLFKKNLSKNDSVLSVERIQNHMWKDETSAPLNYNPWDKKHTLAKDLDPAFFQTGGIFIQLNQNIKKNNYFFGKKPKFILHNQIEALDLNTEDDFLIAESLVSSIDNNESFI